MAQHDAGTAGSQITQAELSCLQIDSREDLVGEGAEHAAVSAQRNLSGVSCCDWGPFTSGKKKQHPSCPQHTPGCRAQFHGQANTPAERPKDMQC